ncbi:MAG: tetratricopeptide repeat protein [Holosporaceae bacterium]|jgi:TolA-binding protein|nr:tetratricopeptide repeat protein [Holosporaceae bacterium]
MRKKIYALIILGFVLNVDGRNQKSAPRIYDNSELEETVRFLNGKIEEIEQKICQIEAKIATLNQQNATLAEFVDKKLKEEKEKILWETMDKKTPEEIIKIAENMIENKKSEDAKNLLNVFLKKNPQSIYKGIMLFYLGNCYVNNGNLQEAALKYMESYKTNPKGRKANEALYNLSVCFGKLNKKQQQKSTLEKMLRDFASGTLAAQAKKDLAALE